MKTEADRGSVMCQGHPGARVWQQDEDPRSPDATVSPQAGNNDGVVRTTQVSLPPGDG